MYSLEHDHMTSIMTICLSANILYFGYFSDKVRSFPFVALHQSLMSLLWDQYTL